jgi:hypothetical protein
VNGKKQQPSKPVEKKVTVEPPPPPKEEAAKAVPMPWGGGKTFADVLKKVEL